MGVFFGGFFFLLLLLSTLFWGVFLFVLLWVCFVFSATCSLGSGLILFTRTFQMMMSQIKRLFSLFYLSTCTSLRSYQKMFFQEQHLNLHSIYYMQKFMFVCENLLHTHSSTTSFLLSSSQPPRISPLYHRNNPPNTHNQTKNPRGQQHNSKGD